MAEEVIRLTDFEARLLREMVERNITPHELAAERGVAHSTIRQRVRDARKRNPGRDRLALGLALLRGEPVEWVRS